MDKHSSLLVRPVRAWLLVLALLAVFPLLPEPIGSKFHVELLSKVMIMAIFAASLQLLVGITGLVSLGHAAFFGFGAYAVAMLAPMSEAGNGWLMLAAAVGGAGLLALLVGALVMRTQGIYFIMVTLAFGQLVYFVFHDTRIAGGSDGAYIYFKPDFSIAGWQAIDLEKAGHFHGFVLAGLALTLAVLGLVLRSRFGHALAGIRHNEQRMRAAGYPTLLYKLGAFVLAGMLAGLGGFLYAAQYGFVTPEILSWHYSGNALVMIILGGLGSLGGAVAGAFAFVLLSEGFSALTRHWQLLFGGFIILAVALLPQGLAGLRLRRPRRARPTPTATDTPRERHA
ncbi:branched-chain amino acid ABC transporter permease [Sphaerotilus uruguayifluvii]|uniref:Branched-chain amino acid transport system permease protein n=1 Tax=Sphaerotilus uruguayifluvii TaxID=2735897 RepID=A0ABX2G6X3_9BURK|nr:branched-chain amino acid ABC transporter permease [Leptothrix sp. C29]NRT57794.1 branched-chain amino acid transport system permease protein [Leptothrix sp. C29]